MLQILSIILIFVIFLGTLALIIPLFLAMMKGAPYMPTKARDVDAMLELANIKPGDLAADLGSGDGRLVIALAERGIEAHGYEINPWLVWWSQLLIKRARVKHTEIFCASFWNRDYSQYDVILLYVLPGTMAKLEDKLKKELKPGSRVVTNTFIFPHWKPSKSNGQLHVYTVPHS
jgi:ribosomal protein L11 methylase PrmA